MEIVLYDSANIKSVDEVIAIFSLSDNDVKNIVILELLGLMYADGGYDDDEKDFVAKVASGIGLSEDKLQAIEKSVAKYIDVTRELFECVES